MKPNLFVLLFGCLHAIVAAWDRENAHYWTDYKKDVPREAFPGGADGRGKTTYIGQAFHEACGKTISIYGQIFEGEQKMKFEYDYAEQQTETNVTILCIKDPGYLEWIKTSVEDFPTLANRSLIHSGIDDNGATIYIGRVHADDHIAVGRIVVGVNNHLSIWNRRSLNGLYTTIDGKHLHVISSFEVLGYKENSRGSETTGSGTTDSGTTGSGTTGSSNASYVIVVACVLRFLYSI